MLIERCHYVPPVVLILIMVSPKYFIPLSHGHFSEVVHMLEIGSRT